MKPLTILLALIAALAAATTPPLPKTAAWETTANAADKVIMFSDLAEGDELFVKLVLSGCFHHSAYEFTFRRGKSFTVEIAQIEEKRLRPDKEYERISSRRIGDLTLTDAEVKELDQMLTYYRSGPRGSGSHFCELWLTPRREGETSATEYLSDSSPTEANRTSRGSLMDLIGRARVRRELPSLEWIYRN